MQKYSAYDLLAIPEADRPFQIKMVERAPIQKSAVLKRFTYMSSSPIDGAAYIGEETGYYMVKPEESIIFYTGGSGELNNLLVKNDFIRKK
jgi:hypothetical protein